MSLPLEDVAEIGSTSEELKRRAALDAPECALLARRQTAGRGRMGRAWQTIDGNLFLSVLLRPSGRFMPGHWSLLAAVALAETIAPHCGAGLRLKWPNDLMLDGGKLAGILLEAASHPAPWLVVGFGVNLAGAPADIGRPTIALPGIPPGPVEVAHRLLLAIQAWRALYEAEGFAPVRTAWLARGHRPGDPLSISGRPAGLFRTISDDGALVVDGPGGPAALLSGEIT